MPKELPQPILDILTCRDTFTGKVRQILDSNFSDEIKAAALVAYASNAPDFSAKPRPLLNGFFASWIGRSPEVEPSLLPRILQLVDKVGIHSDAVARELFQILCEGITELALEGRAKESIMVFLGWTDEISYSNADKILQAIAYASYSDLTEGEVSFIVNAIRQKAMLCAEAVSIDGFWYGRELDDHEFIKWYKLYSGDKYLNGEKVKKTEEKRYFLSVKESLRDKAARHPKFERLVFLVDMYFELKKQYADEMESLIDAGTAGGGSRSNVQNEKSKAKQNLRAALTVALNAIFSAKNDFQLEQRIGHLIKTLYEQSRGEHKASWIKAREGVVSHRLRDSLDALLERFNAAKEVERANGLIPPSVAECERALFLAAVALPIDEFQRFVQKHLNKKTFSDNLKSLTAHELQILLYRTIFFTDAELVDAFLKPLGLAVSSRNIQEPQLDCVKTVVKIFAGINRYMSVLAAGKPSAEEFSLVSRFHAQLKDILIQVVDSGSDLRDSNELYLLLKNISAEADRGGYKAHWNTHAKLNPSFAYFFSRFSREAGADQTAAAGGGAAAAASKLTAVDVFKMLADKSVSAFFRYLRGLETDAAREECFNMTDPDTDYSLLSYIMVDKARSELFLNGTMQVLMTLNPEKVTDILLRRTGPADDKFVPLSEDSVLEKLNAKQVLLILSKVIPDFQSHSEDSSIFNSAAVNRLLQCINAVLASDAKLDHEVIDLINAIDDVSCLPGVQWNSRLKLLIALLRKHFNLVDKVHSLRSPEAIRLALFSCFTRNSLDQKVRERLLHQLRDNMAVITFIDGREDRLSFDYQLAEIGVELRDLVGDYGERSDDEGIAAKEDVCLTLLDHLVEYAASDQGNRLGILKTQLHAIRYLPKWSAAMEGVTSRLRQLFDRLNDLIPDISEQQKMESVRYLLDKEAKKFNIPSLYETLPKGRFLFAFPVYLYALKELPGLTDYWFNHEKHVQFLRRLVFSVDTPGDMDQYVPFILERLLGAEPQSQREFIFQCDHDTIPVATFLFGMFHQSMQAVIWAPYVSDCVMNWLAKNMHRMHIEFLRGVAAMIVRRPSCSESTIIRFHDALAGCAAQKGVSTEIKQLACLAKASMDLEDLSIQYQAKEETDPKVIVRNKLHRLLKGVFPNAVPTEDYNKLLAQLVVYVAVLGFSDLGAAAEKGVESRLQAVLDSLRQSFPLQLGGPFVREILEEKIAKVTSDGSQFDDNLALLKLVVETGDPELTGQILQKEGIFIALSGMIKSKPDSFCRLLKSLQKYHNTIFKQLFDDGKTLLFVAGSDGGKTVVNAVVSAILQLPSNDYHEIFKQAVGGKSVIDLPQVRDCLEMIRNIGALDGSAISKAAADVLEADDLAPRRAGPGRVSDVSFTRFGGGAAKPDDPFTGPGGPGNDKL